MSDNLRPFSLSTEVVGSGEVMARPAHRRVAFLLWRRCLAP